MIGPICVESLQTLKKKKKIGRNRKQKKKKKADKVLRHIMRQNASGIE